MKFSKVVISFPSTPSGRTVLLQALGSEYAVQYHAQVVGLRKALGTLLFPGEFNDPAYDGEMPDELECVLATGELAMEHIGHYLMCDEHAHIERLMLSEINSNMERSKVKYPHISEMMLEGVIVGLAAEISPTEAVRLGMVNDRLVNREPNPEEVKVLSDIGRMLAGTRSGEILPPEFLADVVLDFQPYIPAMTDDERAELDAFTQNREDARRSTRAAMATHPHHLH